MEVDSETPVPAAATASTSSNPVAPDEEQEEEAQSKSHDNLVVSYIDVLGRVSSFASGCWFMMLTSLY